MGDGLFLQSAKVQTMVRDFDRLRAAIRSHDSFAAEEAWERCERWISVLPAEAVDAVRKTG